MGTKLKPSPHDAWDRAEDSEPRLAFLARDVLSPPLLRAYAAAISGDVDRVKACFVRLIRNMSARQYRPEKDAQHVISARETANAMELWYIDKQKAVLNERHIANELDQTKMTESPYGVVSIRNDTGPHSEAEDRWTVVETPENPHLVPRKTQFIGQLAEARARHFAECLLAA